MQKLRLGITFRDDVPLDQVFGSNGLSQNVKFLYDLFVELGHDPFLIVGTRPEAEHYLIQGRKYETRSYQQLMDTGEPFDIAFEVAVTIGKDVRDQMRNINGAKIVAVRYGHTMLMDMEALFANKQMPSGIVHVGKPEILWISPHFEKSISYLETLYKCPVRICPFLWEPDFVPRRFLRDEYPEVPDIYVMEPNFSVLKNALIPMAIIERLYQDASDSFGRATILNGLHYNDEQYFLDNFAANFESLIAENEKVYFTGRYRFSEAFQRPDILLSHQWECELNYLYMEALYMNVPLVHNSPALKDVGFYYEGFDVSEGAKRVGEAIATYDYKSQREGNEVFLRGFSIHNPELQQQYASMIEEAMSQGVEE